MRCRIVSILLLCGLCGLARAQTTYVLPDTTALDQAERDLLHFEQARSAAIAAKNLVALRGMYATDFRGVTALGAPVTLDQLIGVFVQDDQSTAFTVDSITVHVLGATREVAVLTARLTARRRAGGDLIAQTRFEHVYIWRDQRWQIFTAQGTLIPIR